jgi:hypothetical protein
MSEMEKCTSNINFDGWPFDHWNDHKKGTRVLVIIKQKNVLFTSFSLNRNEIQKVVLIPLMQKFLLRHIYIYKMYLFIRTKRGIMKVKIYMGFTYVHCLFVVAVRYFIGRKDFRNFFSLFFATHGQSISYREVY